MSGLRTSMAPGGLPAAAAGLPWCRRRSTRHPLHSTAQQAAPLRPTRACAASVPLPPSCRLPSGEQMDAARAVVSSMSLGEGARAPAADREMRLALLLLAGGWRLAAGGCFPALMCRPSLVHPPTRPPTRQAPWGSCRPPPAGCLWNLAHTTCNPYSPCSPVLPTRPAPPARQGPWRSCWPPRPPPTPRSTASTGRCAAGTAPAALRHRGGAEVAGRGRRGRRPSTVPGAAGARGAAAAADPSRSPHLPLPLPPSPLHRAQGGAGRRHAAAGGRRAGEGAGRGRCLCVCVRLVSFSSKSGRGCGCHSKTSWPGNRAGDGRCSRVPRAPWCMGAPFHRPVARSPTLNRETGR